MRAILAVEIGKDSGLLRRWGCGVDGLLNVLNVQRGEAKAHGDSLQKFSRCVPSCGASRYRAGSAGRERTPAVYCKLP